MHTNMWCISLLDEGVSNIIPAYSDGSMMLDLGATPIIECFSKKTFMNVKTQARLYNSTMQKWGISAHIFGAKPSPQDTSRDDQVLLQHVSTASSR